MHATSELLLQIEVITEICQMLLEYGAEISRVEKYAASLSKAYEIRNTNIFVIPHYMTISYTDDSANPITKAIRCKNKGTDLTKIELISRLINRITENPKLEFDVIYSELKNIRNSKAGISFASILAYIGIAITHTLLFSGTAIDSLCAALCSLTLYSFDQVTRRSRISDVILKLLEAMLLAFVSFWCVSFLSSLGITGKVDSIIKGNIMLLVPGIKFTNGIRDFFNGDLLSAILHVVDAILTTVAIAIGIGVVFYLYDLLNGMGIL